MSYHHLACTDCVAVLCFTLMASTNFTMASGCLLPLGSLYWPTTRIRRKLLTTFVLWFICLSSSMRVRKAFLSYALPCTSGCEHPVFWRPFGSRCIHMYLHVSVLYRVCMRKVSISQILYRLHCVSFRICRVSTLVSCALYEYPLDDRCCYFRPLGRHSVGKYLRDGISWI